MKISKRAKEMQASPIRKLTPYAQAAKDKGRKIFHLNIGQPDIETPDIMFKAIREYKEKILAYGPSQGSADYCDSLVKYYNKLDFAIEKEHLVVTTGGSEAIIFAMLAVADPGGEIIVPEPFYTNYNGFATQAGLTIVPVLTVAENGFHLPAEEEVEKRITPHTRALMLCNPNNPTGTVYTRDEVEMMIRIAVKHRLFLISDEVYREFIYDGLKHVSVMEFPEAAQNLIVVDSISKRFSACGARLGAVISKNAELMSGIMKFAQARLCPPTLEQIGGVALHSLNENYYRKIRSEYQHRRDIVVNSLSKMPGVICKKPQGAFYVIAKLPVIDAEHYALWLLTDFDSNGETVMVAPAQGFYSTPNMGLDEVRLAYILNEKSLLRAMDVLAESLEKYKGKKEQLQAGNEMVMQA
ncbi:MAG: pyridoxal phosphate-dependent aminotransferase [Candidatus Wallbacteria bacterium]|nr:pyridoxal phosphate-dependent aminotransferase [Candidatus Wallbacteria bacterium]